MSSKIVALLILIAVQNVELLEKEEDPFTNTWAAHIEGGPEVAKRVAEEHGYEIIRQVGVVVVVVVLFFWVFVVCCCFFLFSGNGESGLRGRGFKI
jgi:hypothetical protein